MSRHGPTSRQGSIRSETAAAPAEYTRRGRAFFYSTVTDLARFRGLSMSQPRISAT